MKHEAGGSLDHLLHGAGAKALGMDDKLRLLAQVRRVAPIDPRLGCRGM